MSFLSIAFLVGLPLAALPVLLHLFDRRRNVEIEWGAMQFLVEAQAQQTSSRRLKQWLLVAMRVLALTALIFALAQPMMPGSWFGNVKRSETVLLLDNSMSMMRKSGEATLFDDAVDEAIQRIDAIKTGDSVRVLLASPYPIWATTGSVRVDVNSRRTLISQLQQVRPTAGSSDLLSSLFTAVQAEVDPTHHRRHVVVLTDGQSTDWNLSDKNSWARFRNVLESTSVPTQLDVVQRRVPKETVHNVAVNEVRSNQMVVGTNQPFTLTARVQNHGDSAGNDSTATWSIDDESVHKSDVPSLDAGETQSVVWKHSFGEQGVYSVSCIVDNSDDLLADNDSTVVVHVVDEIPVVVVDDAIDQAEMQQDAFFVQAALGWINGDPLPHRSVHVPTLVRSDRLRQLNLSDQRAVVIPNFTKLDPETIEQLREFVFAGGGLWIALGPRSDIESFNELLFADGSGLAPLAVGRMVEDTVVDVEDETQNERTRIDAFGESHPATAALAGNEQLDLGSVRVTQRFEFVLPPDGEGVSELLKLTNGKPLAVEKYVGRGRVIIQSVPLKLQWTELAKSQAFVVMVQNWLSYLSQPRATRHNLEPGDPIALELVKTDSQHASLTTPHGDEIDLTAESLPSGHSLFRSSRTVLPGEYALDVGLAGDAIPFYVRRDLAESDLATLSADDQKTISEVTGLNSTDEVMTAGSVSNLAPIWPLLLVVVIVLIALELLLSGLISNERFGSEAIAESAEVPDLSGLFASRGGNRDRRSSDSQHVRVPVNAMPSDSEAAAV